MPVTVAAKTVVIVGGGFSGALFGLKLHARCPDWRIVVAEPKKKLGRGVAYGACAPHHLLNVPVSRMEVGLRPSFAAWLAERRGALADSVPDGADLSTAFVPRRLFGDYVEERVNAALDGKSPTGLTAVRGEVVHLLRDRRGVLLTDGRELAADIVVLAMGNLPPRAPAGPDRWLYDTGFFIPDPWALDAFSDVAPDEPLLLIGTGLTAVDIALNLAQHGHRGPLLALSRRGLAPQTHAAGGAWPDFVPTQIPTSTRGMMRFMREQIAAAAAQGVGWQRVFDAARPAVPTIWNGWNAFSRRQFLRHARPRWDVHRHRMPPRVSAALAQLRAAGAIEIQAGRIHGYRLEGRQVDVAIRLRRGGMREFRAGHVVNCTGPDGDFSTTAIPLIAQLRERRLAVPDPLGIGIETRDCAVVDGAGTASSWLFALGPVTRPSWWEITAVPEINLQIDRLVAQLSSPVSAARLTAADFRDMGGGI